MMNRKMMSLVLVLTSICFSGMVVKAQIMDTGIKFPTEAPDPRSGCVIPKIDGERVPFPLKTANTKFELAENETYILNGTIIQQSGKSFFKVDFASQPWLATHKRIQFPLFLIDANGSDSTKKFNGNLVQMAVVVRKQDVSTSGQEWDASLVLSVIANPVLLK